MQRELAFDASAASAARDAGMEISVDTLPAWNTHLLEAARAQARIIARTSGAVSADDVVKHFADDGIDLTAKLGNAMGSLFRGSEWEWTGRFIRSTRVHAHCNLLRVWRLRTGRTA